MKWSDEASFLIVEFGVPRNTTRASRRTRAIESRGGPRFSVRIPLQLQKTSWNKIRKKVAGRVMLCSGGLAVEFAVGSGCRGVTPVSSPSVGSGVLGQRALHGRPSLCHARGASSDVTTDKRWSAKISRFFGFTTTVPSINE